MKAELVRSIDGERNQRCGGELSIDDIKSGERHCREQFNPVLFTAFDSGVHLYIFVNDEWFDFDDAKLKLLS